MNDSSNVAEFTVSELSFALKRTVEDAYGFVRVRGEISGWRGAHSSGHAYFALKDDKARLEAVIWKGAFQKMRVRPEEGMEVIATGKLTTFPGSSKYQIVVEAMEPAGVGALMALLEERKRKLAAEGLFDPARKQLLPYMPRVIGVVTSPTGAVIRDILHRVADRFPVRVIVWPVRVQGEGSGAEVAAAIRGFGMSDAPFPMPDVMIVARGGGSLEDLWGFNDEEVVRAVAESMIPVISAVGHETDWTLIDLVADMRAPTPTGAAEMAVPVRSELLTQVDGLARRHASAVTRLYERRRTDLRAAGNSLPSLRDLLALPRQRLDRASGQLGAALAANTASHRQRFARLAGRIAPGLLSLPIRHKLERAGTLVQRLRRSLDVQAQRRATTLQQASSLLALVSYTAVLGRGFVLVRDIAGLPVKSALAVQVGDGLRLQFSDGDIGVVAGGASADQTREPKPSKPKKADKTPKPKEGQQSLF